MIGIINCDLDESNVTNGAYILHGMFENSKIIHIISGEKFDVKDFDSFIITGSRATYNDGLEWIRYLRLKIIEMDEYNIKCFGICFGMQLICDVFGGVVELNGEKEEGFTEIKCVSKKLIGSDSPIKVYQAHYDFVQTLPKSAILLARNDVCIQAFSLRNFVCTQFHPEVDSQIAIIMATRDNLDVNEILAGVGDEYDFPRNMIRSFIE